MTRDTPKVVLADEGRCAYSRECFPSHAAKDTRKAWCAKHNLYMRNGRVYARVLTVRFGEQYMDAVTGHLFDPDPEYVRNQAEAAALLCAMKKQREFGLG